MKMRRLAGLFLWHMGGEPSSRAQEAQASITTYPTHTRRTFAAPQKRPASGTNAAGPIPEDTRNEQHRNAT